VEGVGEGMGARGRGAVVSLNTNKSSSSSSSLSSSKEWVQGGSIYKYRFMKLMKWGKKRKFMMCFTSPEK
jgi:hypothetical protein